jgi:DNA-3-methyladenine glycosylase
VTRPRRVPERFFARDATTVAPELLNKVLRIGSVEGRILEVEAYTADDPASHSFRGRTARNEVMFGRPGRLYIYFIYGMHHCVNVVTGPVGSGEAVLIRAAAIDGIELGRTNGPGKLAREFEVDLVANGTIAMIYDDGTDPPSDPMISPRIGITKAADWPRRWQIPG